MRKQLERTSVRSSLLILFVLFFYTPVSLFSLAPLSSRSEFDTQNPKNKGESRNISQIEEEKEDPPLSIFQKRNREDLSRRFDSKKQIGDGAYGVVAKTKEGTVIKKAKKRIDQEVFYAITRMNYRGVCPVKSYQIKEDYLYYEMPFYPENLKTIIKEKSDEEKKSILFQIFCTFSAFWENHIDIFDRKSRNMMLDFEGNVVFIDIENSSCNNIIYSVPKKQIYQYFSEMKFSIPPNIKNVMEFWIKEFHQFENLDPTSEKSFAILGKMMADIVKDPFFDTVRNNPHNLEYLLELKNAVDFMTADQKKTLLPNIIDKSSSEEEGNETLNFEEDPKMLEFQKNLLKNVKSDLQAKSIALRASFYYNTDNKHLDSQALTIFDKNTAIFRYEMLKILYENFLQHIRWKQNKNPVGFLPIRSFQIDPENGYYICLETPVPFFVNFDLIDVQKPSDQKAIFFQILAEISFLSQNKLFTTDYKALFKLSTGGAFYEAPPFFMHIFRDSENKIIMHYIPQNIFDGEKSFDLRNLDHLINFITKITPSISQKLLDELCYKFYDICLSEHCDKEVEIGFLFTDIMKSSFFDSVRDGSYEQELLSQLKNPERFLPNPLKNETEESQNAEGVPISAPKTQIIEEGMSSEYVHIMKQIQQWNHRSLAQIGSLKEEGERLSYEMPIYQKLSRETLNLEEKKLIFAEILLTISYLYERGVSPFPLSLKENVGVDENKRAVLLPSTKWHYLIERDDALSWRSFLLEFSDSFSSQEDRVKLERLFEKRVFRAKGEKIKVDDNRRIFVDFLKEPFFDSVRDRVEYWKNLNLLKKKDLFMTEQQLQKSA